jgi:ABC-type multidrug transport system fused ATPase/permease subunit
MFTPPPQQSGISEQRVQQIIGEVMTDYNNNVGEAFGRMEEDMVRRMDEIQAKLDQQPAVTPVATVKHEPIIRTFPVKSSAKQSNESVVRQWSKEDAVEDKINRMGVLGREAVGIIGGIITLLLAALPWFGITLTAEQVDMFVIGVGALSSAIALAIGLIGTLTARQNVYSKASVAKIEGGKS